MNGAERIAKERQRQIEKEGWTAEHDDGYLEDELAIAAACYAFPDNVRLHPVKAGETRLPLVNCFWPEPMCWKPTPGNRIRELEKAGALIAAEIDRLLRLEN
jgi:hypothetical protein